LAAAQGGGLEYTVWGLWSQAMASVVVRTYNGGLRAVLAVGSTRSKVPVQGVTKRNPPAPKLKAILKLSDRYCALDLTICPFGASHISFLLYNYAANAKTQLDGKTIPGIMHYIQQNGIRYF